MNPAKYFDQHPYVFLALVVAACFLWLRYELRAADRKHQEDHLNAIRNMRLQRYLRSLERRINSCTTSEQLDVLSKELPESLQEDLDVQRAFTKMIIDRGAEIVHETVAARILTYQTEHQLEQITEAIERWHGESIATNRHDIAQKLYSLVTIQRAAIAATRYTEEERS